MDDGIWTLLQNDVRVLFQFICVWWVMALISGGLLMLKIYSRLTLGVCKYEIDLSGKTVIITGGNTGIGKEAAKDLARRHASVVLACRNQERAKMAAEDIVNSTGNKKIEAMELDLSSQKSVREFVEEFKRTHDRLDILINNAGVFALPERTLTVDGYEMTFATNHLGHFLLTNLLLEMLMKCAPSRIITVSSASYRLGIINFDNLNSERYYISDIAYSHTKLANILFTRKLANRLAGTGVTAYSLHPGLVCTNIFRHYHGVRKFLVDLIVTMYGKTAEEGAQTTIYLAVAPGVESLSGDYFADCKVMNTSPKTRDMDVAQKLWDVSEHMTKLHPQTHTDTE
ncbi:retinol dehydrogenase 11-like [Limulus polyphemus]|uniref:Retinol dehydrogenase 11-like n=1 Tax=Limulus polyphemus TaxID=6850 RepID=A0ABM1T768_LIMPO|nr:retinol dehydrogenase 11-like [Limulus polyphemus]